MKLVNLKTRIVAILPDERNETSWTWGELLSALFVVVTFLVLTALYVAAKLLG